jgi:diguanylate cyclase
MLLEFFQNACILITFISISHHFLKDKDISQNPSLNLKAIIGFLSGLLGITLMLNSVRVMPTVIMDFRYIPILLSAIYGGVLPAIIASLMIGIFRMLYSGISQSSIVGLIVAFLGGTGFSIITFLKLSKKKKWIYSIFFLLLVISIAFRIVLKDTKVLFEVITIYCIGNILVSYFIFHYTEYLSETVQFYKKLKNQATKDFLTGLNNVRQFDVEFNRITELTMRKEEKLSLLYIDIDYFKKVNDTYGHNAGDIILKSLASILINTCRIFDVISRNGGEEFSILLLDCSAPHAVEIAERLRRNIEMNKFIISDKDKINITISIGISTYPDTTDKIDWLLEHGDTALYEAKRSGRNKVVLYKMDKIS